MWAARGEGWCRIFTGASRASNTLTKIHATRQDIDGTTRKQQSPHPPPDNPHYQASDLEVPKTYEEAMESERQHLWSDSMKKEVRGLLSAGTIAIAS